MQQEKCQQQVGEEPRTGKSAHLEGIYPDSSPHAALGSHTASSASSPSSLLEAASGLSSVPARTDFSVISVSLLFNKHAGFSYLVSKMIEGMGL